MTPTASSEGVSLPPIKNNDATITSASVDWELNRQRNVHVEARQTQTQDGGCLAVAVDIKVARRNPGDRDKRVSVEVLVPDVLKGGSGEDVELAYLDVEVATDECNDSGFNISRAGKSKDDRFWEEGGVSQSDAITRTASGVEGRSDGTETTGLSPTRAAPRLDKGKAPAIVSDSESVPGSTHCQSSLLLGKADGHGRELASRSPDLSDRDDVDISFGVVPNGTSSTVNDGLMGEDERKNNDAAVDNVGKVASGAGDGAGSQDARERLETHSPIQEPRQKVDKGKGRAFKYEWEDAPQASAIPSSDVSGEVGGVAIPAANSGAPVLMQNAGLSASTVSTSQLSITTTFAYPSTERRNHAIPIRTASRFVNQLQIPSLPPPQQQPLSPSYPQALASPGGPPVVTPVPFTQYPSPSIVVNNETFLSIVQRAASATASPGTIDRPPNNSVGSAPPPATTTYPTYPPSARSVISSVSQPIYNHQAAYSTLGRPNPVAMPLQSISENATLHLQQYHRQAPDFYTYPRPFVPSAAMATQIPNRSMPPRRSRPRLLSLLRLRWVRRRRNASNEQRPNSNSSAAPVPINAHAGPSNTDGNPPLSQPRFQTNPRNSSLPRGPHQYLYTNNINHPNHLPMPPSFVTYVVPPRFVGSGFGTSSNSVYPAGNGVGGPATIYPRGSSLTAPRRFAPPSRKRYTYVSVRRDYDGLEEDLPEPSPSSAVDGTLEPDSNCNTTLPNTTLSGSSSTGATANQNSNHNDHPTSTQSQPASSIPTTQSLPHTQSQSQSQSQLQRHPQPHSNHLAHLELATCPLCADVCERAMRTICCGQTSCSICLWRWFSSPPPQPASSSSRSRNNGAWVGPSCPFCRAKVGPPFAVPAMDVQGVADGLVVRCLGGGCKWVGPRRELGEHVRSGCPWRGQEGGTGPKQETISGAAMVTSPGQGQNEEHLQIPPQTMSSQVMDAGSAVGSAASADSRSIVEPVAGVSFVDARQAVPAATPSGASGAAPASVPAPATTAPLAPPPPEESTSPSDPANLASSFDFACLLPHLAMSQQQHHLHRWYHYLQHH
ncbi:hypothetical protein HK102_013994 [Quaeritorhiza haematococci]|nr:hypothetical protein HK102_013994 [Quaeritorhiza haematococci]